MFEIIESLLFNIQYKLYLYEEINNIIKQFIITVKPFVQSPLNDRDPSNFDRGLDNGYIGFQNFNSFINSYI